MDPAPLLSHHSEAIVTPRWATNWRWIHHYRLIITSLFLTCVAYPTYPTVSSQFLSIPQWVHRLPTVDMIIQWRWGWVFFTLGPRCKQSSKLYKMDPMHRYLSHHRYHFHHTISYFQGKHYHLIHTTSISSCKLEIFSQRHFPLIMYIHNSLHISLKHQQRTCC